MAEIKGFMQKGHVVLVVKIAERRLKVEQGTSVIRLGLYAVFVRLSGFRTGEKCVGNRLESRVASVKVTIVEVQTKLVDVGERVDGRTNATDLAPAGGAHVRVAGAHDGARRGSVGGRGRDLPIVRGEARGGGGGSRVGVEYDEAPAALKLGQGEDQGGGPAVGGGVPAPGGVTLPAQHHPGVPGSRRHLGISGTLGIKPMVSLKKLWGKKIRLIRFGLY